MFLRIDGIPGEAMDESHVGEIDVLSWNWGLSHPGGIASGGVISGGNANFQDISATKYVDKASTVLMSAVASGTFFNEAELTVRKSDGAAIELMRLTMNDLLVTSLATGGSSGEDKLTENISLNFARFTKTVTYFAGDGSAAGVNFVTWDIPNAAGSIGSGPPPDPPPNTAPTVSDVGAQSVDEDGSITLDFTVGDVESVAGALTVNLGSSNPAILPLDRMTLGGGGAHRTVTLSPAPEASGAVEVTLEVSDGDLAVSDSFILTVNAINDAPTIGAIAAQVTETNTPIDLAVTLGDVDSSLNGISLTATATPAELIASLTDLTQSGGTRTLRVTPATGANGLTLLTLTATDDAGGTSEIEVPLTINPPSGTGLVAVLINGLSSATPIALPENAPVATAIGLLDADDTPGVEHTFTILSSPGPFALVSVPGGVSLQVADSAFFDFETTPSLAVTIQATDQSDPARTRTDTFTIQLSNVNEPTFVTLANDPFGQAQAEIPTLLEGISLADPDAGSNPIVFTVTAHDSILSVDPGGIIAGRTEGSGTATLVITAPAAEIAAELAANGLTLQSDPGFLGPIALQFSTHDQGHTGSGGAQTDVIASSIEIVESRWETWRETHFTVLERADPQISGFDADADDDGLANGGEYGLCTDPRDPREGPAAVTTSTIRIGPFTYPVVSFTRRIDDPRLVIAVEVATNLSNWNGAAGLTEELSSTTLSPEKASVDIRTTQSLEDDPHMQLRLSFALE